MEAYSKEVRKKILIYLCLRQCLCFQVEVPLSTAKKLVKLSADKYNTEFSLRQYVSVCRKYITR